MNFDLHQCQNWRTLINKTHVVSDGFLDGEALVVDVLGVPDGEDGVGRDGAGQPRPGHLRGVCVNVLSRAGDNV